MKNLIAMFTALLPKKSVEGILSAFHNTVAELESHAEAMKAKAAKHMRTAEEAEAAAQAALDEHYTATVASSGIKNLLAGDFISQGTDTGRFLSFPESHQDQVGAP